MSVCTSSGAHALERVGLACALALTQRIDS